jgi:hypothetical protein
MGSAMGDRFGGFMNQMGGGAQVEGIGRSIEGLGGGHDQPQAVATRGDSSGVQIAAPQGTPGADQTYGSIQSSMGTLKGVAGPFTGMMGGGSGGGEPQGAGNAQAQIDTSPMRRRLSTMEEDPAFQIAQAKASLSSMPPAYQQQYGPALDEAYKRAMNNKRSGMNEGYYA